MPYVQLDALNRIIAIAEQNQGTGWVWRNDPVELYQEPRTDWVGFRLAMLADSGYMRVSKIIQQLNPQVIEVFQITIKDASPNLPIAQSFWKQGLDSVWGNLLAVKPTAAEIAAWNANATTYKAPLLFDSKGYILLK